MIHIPSSEIQHDSLQLDPLGYTFIWRGHFLRGIRKESVYLVQSYFTTGFLEELISRKLFPETVISDFENEQFGLILEHRKITPVVLASEWNSAMLKDASLMVLNIAEIALKYGYNMIDCHTRNVLFENNMPVYVDLGSFQLNQKGCKGWIPYKSFMECYAYPLYYFTKMGGVL